MCNIAKVAHWGISFRGSDDVIPCSTKRTKVFDDESDHFSVDSSRWLSVGERERLRSKEETLRDKIHESRRNKPLTIDFAGRKIVENTEKIGK